MKGEPICAMLYCAAGRQGWARHSVLGCREEVKAECSPLCSLDASSEEGESCSHSAEPAAIAPHSTLLSSPLIFMVKQAGHLLS